MALHEERRVERQSDLRRREREIEKGVVRNVPAEHRGRQERPAERRDVGEVVELDEVEAVRREGRPVESGRGGVPRPEGDLREAVRVGEKALGAERQDRSEVEVGVERQNLADRSGKTGRRQGGVIQDSQRPLAVPREVGRLVRQVGQPGSDVTLEDEDVAAAAGQGVGVEALLDLGEKRRQAGGPEGEKGAQGGPAVAVLGAARCGHGRLLVRMANEKGGRRAGRAATGAPFSALKIRTRGVKKLLSATRRKPSPSTSIEAIWPGLSKTVPKTWPVVGSNALTKSWNEASETTQKP